MIFLKLVPALFLSGEDHCEHLQKCGLWGMYEQYACAVLIKWLVVECSVCVSLGAVVSVINGCAWTVP